MNSPTPTWDPFRFDNHSQEFVAQLQKHEPPPRCHLAVWELCLQVLHFILLALQLCLRLRSRFRQVHHLLIPGELSPVQLGLSQKRTPSYCVACAESSSSKATPGSSQPTRPVSGKKEPPFVDDVEGSRSRDPLSQTLTSIMGMS